MVAVAVASGVASAAASGSVHAKAMHAQAVHSKAASGKIVIGYSQNYSGNTFHKIEEGYFFNAAKQLEKAGKISGYDFVDANNSVTTQISQIEDLVLKHVSLIVVDPASGTALNGAFEAAAKAHIPVLETSDGPVTSSIPYQVNFDDNTLMNTLGAYVVGRLHGKGDVLNVRGIAGTADDQLFNDGLLKSFQGHPGMKVVDTIYGSWTGSTTEQAVAQALPTLGNVQAVLNQGGGEAYGIVQAFEGKTSKFPIIVGDNLGNFLQWWAAEHKKTGYTTESMSANPAIGAVDVYLAMDILAGQKVPKHMTLPWLKITQATLSQYKNVGANGVAASAISASWVEKNLVK
jgi:ribose transport system substrate-binding protein